MSTSRVSFVRALFFLFYVSLVRFKPGARAFAWNLVAANMAGLLFLPRVEPVVLWIAIVTGLVFMVRVYQKMGFVRLLGAGPLVAIRRAVARFPMDEPAPRRQRMVQRMARMGHRDRHGLPCPGRPGRGGVSQGRPRHVLRGALSPSRQLSCVEAQSCSRSGTV